MAKCAAVGNGAVFERCSDLSINECWACIDGSSCPINQVSGTSAIVAYLHWQDVVMCRVNWNAPCETQQACEASGTCSDRYFFGATDPKPACIEARTDPLDEYQDYYFFPFCPDFDQACSI